MIVFDLDCNEGHRFEGWFRSREDFSDQKDAGIITCPECGSADVRKAVSTPNLGSGRGKGSRLRSVHGPDDPVAQSLGAPSLPPKLEAELERVFAKVRRHVEKTCDYVGQDFAEEARRIHYGETESRSIYGEATAQETAELIDEGIEVMPLPGARPKTDA